MTEQDYATLAHVLSTLVLDTLQGGISGEATRPVVLHTLRLVAERLGHYYSNLPESSISHDYFTEYLANQVITYYGNTDTPGQLLPKPY